MDNTYTSGPTENETKAESSPVTSSGRKSPTKEKPVITPALRLRMLQQAAHDCQEAGIMTRVIPVPGGLAIVVPGAQLDEAGNIVPIPGGESANTANNANTGKRED